MNVVDILPFEFSVNKGHIKVILDEEIQYDYDIRGSGSKEIVNPRSIDVIFFCSSWLDECKYRPILRVYIPIIKRGIK